MPEDIVPIAICGKAPNGWEGPSYPALAPKKWWWIQWKYSENEDLNYYKDMYEKTVLKPLIPLSVINELEQMSGGKDIALVCYEKPENFCHRHIVADWLQLSGISVSEYEKTD